MPQLELGLHGAQVHRARDPLGVVGEVEGDGIDGVVEDVVVARMLHQSLK